MTSPPTLPGMTMLKNTATSWSITGADSGTVSPTRALDFKTYLAAALLIAAVSIAACLRPALRAARGSALGALRIG